MQPDVLLAPSSDLSVHTATVAAAPPLPPSACPPPVRILVIDDEPGILRALKGLLDRRGHTVTTADNGALAWAYLQETRYDVILCDVLMPEIDGTAFYTMLQQYEPSCCARVIFLTGDILGDKTKAFLAHCGQPWLYKPCGAAAVLQAIAQVLRAADSPRIVGA